MSYLTKWLLVEIITFYGLIASAIIYLFVGAIFKFKRENLLKKSLDRLQRKTDFIQATHNLYFYFGLTTT